MCGIAGIIGRKDVAAQRLAGRKRLEYRAYGSARFATLDFDSIGRRRASAKLSSLAQVLEEEPRPGVVGIAHTRGSTHSSSTTNNAHPHNTNDVAVVHKGILQNFKPLRDGSNARDRTFTSETDTDVIAHLVGEKVEAGASPADAVRDVLPNLGGAFALAIVFRSHSDLLIGARQGSPLILRGGEGETYLGSAALALAALTHGIIYLEEGDWIACARDKLQISNKAHQTVERAVTQPGVDGESTTEGNYRHPMIKEIYEQPIALAQPQRPCLECAAATLALPIPDFGLSGIKRITIVPCATSLYAGMIARYWFQQFARLPIAALAYEETIKSVAAEIASARDVLYLDHGADDPLALERALKLKEISYIHAEGYAAGETAHGPVALLDKTLPVVVNAPCGATFRESRQQHAGGADAERQAGAYQRLRLHPGSWRRLPGDDHHAKGPPVNRAFGVQRARGIAGLSRSCHQRHRCRSAAQPCSIVYRRVRGETGASRRNAPAPQGKQGKSR